MGKKYSLDVKNLEKIVLDLLFMKIKIIRFTNFHPVYNNEGFFPNILLQIITFHNEKDLLFENNLELSYVQKCLITRNFTNS